MEIRKRLEILLGSKMVVLAMNGDIRLLPLPEAYCGIALGLNNTALLDDPDRFRSRDSRQPLRRQILFKP